jgi:hypothetical protein
MPISARERRRSGCSRPKPSGPAAHSWPARYAPSTNTRPPITLKPRRPSRRRLSHEAGIKPGTVQTVEAIIFGCSRTASDCVSPSLMVSRVRRKSPTANLTCEFIALMASHRRAGCRQTTSGVAGPATLSFCSLANLLSSTTAWTRLTVNTSWIMTTIYDRGRISGAACAFTSGDGRTVSGFVWDRRPDEGRMPTVTVTKEVHPGPDEIAPT